MHDDRGELVVNDRGAYMPRKVKRRDLNLPHFHSLRHGAAMACEDVEEARDLLRHKTSLVTQAVYRGHFTDRRRELLRARLEARHRGPDEAAPTPSTSTAAKSSFRSGGRRDPRQDRQGALDGIGLDHRLRRRA